MLAVQNKTCTNCGIEFEDMTKSHCAKFCSIKCRSAFKRPLYKRWKADNLVKLAEYQANYYKVNRIARIAQNKKTKHQNWAYYREWFRLNKFKKYHSDPQFKLTCILRSRLKRVLKEREHEVRLPDCGCTIEELKAHIESQFEPRMTWQNWTKDGWHIDHIRPLSSFDLSDPDQLKMANHYSNLRPLWAQDNLSKGAKTDETI